MHKEKIKKIINKKIKKLKKIINENVKKIKEQQRQYKYDTLLRKAVKKMDVPLIINALKNGANPNNIILSPEYEGDKVIARRKADSLLGYAQNYYCIEQGELVEKLLKSENAKKLEDFTYEDFKKIKDLFLLIDSYGYIRHLVKNTYNEYMHEKEERKNKKHQKKIKVIDEEYEKNKKMVEEYLSSK